MVKHILYCVWFYWLILDWLGHFFQNFNQMLRHGVIGEGLGARDHNVTILSPYYVERPEKGVQYLFIDQNHAFTQYGNEAIKRNKKRSAITEFIYLAILTKQMCLGQCAYN